MENKKIIKNLIIGLIALSFLVSIGLNIFQYQQIRKLSKGANGGMPTENQSASDVISGPEVMQGGSSGGMTFTGKTTEPNQYHADDLEYQLNAAEEELDIALKQISDEAARKSELKKKESELQKYFSTFGLSEESMRDSIRSQYSDVFEELNLSPEKQEKIIDILVNNSMASYDFSMEVQNTTPSEEKRAEFAERQRALREDAEEAQEKIKDIMGNTDYEKYLEYNETRGQRYTVNEFVESLNESEKPTEQQQQRLITAMHEQSKKIYSEVYNEMSDEDTKFVFPSERESDYDYEEQMSRSLEYQDRQHEAYLSAAQDILSASQIKQLKAYFQKERDRFKLMMEISALRNAE